MRERLFWSGALSFVLGVALEPLIHVELVGVVWLILLSLILVFTSHVLNARHVGVIMCVGLCAFAVGSLRMYFTPGPSHEGSGYLEKQVLLEGVVGDEVDARESSDRVLIKAHTLTYQGETVRFQNGVIAVLPPHTELLYGDTVVLKGTLTVPKEFETDAGRSFDYKNYLRMQGVDYLLEFALVEKREIGSISLYRALFSIKNHYIHGLALAFTEPYAALAGGITVGDKRSLGKELTDIFRDAGVIHIVVLSGYNITIIVVFLLAALRGTSRKTKVLLGIMMIGMFVVMTGGSATAVRAGLMAVLGLLALSLYRPHLITRALMVAVVLMLVWNPLILMYDPGFQLSVVATLGLIHLSPLISRCVPWITERWGLKEIVASTIGTQIAVLPLLVHHIGTVSLVALPANLVILPLVPLAMLCSAVAGLVGAFSAPLLATIVGFPGHLLLVFITKAAESFASLPYATVHMPAFSITMMHFSYIVMFLAVLFLKAKFGRTSAD